MPRPTRLFPEIEPKDSDKGYLYTDNGHQVYYERCGNPKGKPITFIPGGPGCGCEPKDRRFFNPDKWDVLLIDLRGSGKSRPLGKIEYNTTQLAAKDIYDINHKLGREKTALFGGSWGSTLASFYAITYPETVLGMVLRGIFLGEREEINHYTNGQAATSEYGKAVFARFMGHVTPDWKHDPIGFYYHNMQVSNAHRKSYFAYEWIRFEYCMLFEKPKPEEEIEKEIRSLPFEAWALIEAHYFAHNCFMDDKLLVDSAAAGKFPDVPITIVQGKDDMICPPKYARRLNGALPNSELRLVNGGHSSSEPKILKALVSETDALYDMI
jgi:proline iminopeptidase